MSFVWNGTKLSIFVEITETLLKSTELFIVKKVPQKKSHLGGCTLSSAPQRAHKVPKIASFSLDTNVTTVRLVHPNSCYQHLFLRWISKMHIGFWDVFGTNKFIMGLGQSKLLGSRCHFSGAACQLRSNYPSASLQVVILRCHIIVEVPLLNVPLCTYLWSSAKMLKGINITVKARNTALLRATHLNMNQHHCHHLSSSCSVKLANIQYQVDVGDSKLVILHIMCIYIYIWFFDNLVVSSTSTSSQTKLLPQVLNQTDRIVQASEPP